LQLQFALNLLQQDRAEKYLLGSNQS
jgi:hypothetical protein